MHATNRLKGSNILRRTCFENYHTFFEVFFYNNSSMCVYRLGSLTTKINKYELLERSSKYNHDLQSSSRELYCSAELFYCDFIDINKVKQITLRIKRTLPDTLF